jgi:alkylation response protein AidB-like acyl-CoA dehydrogenase
MLLQELRFVLFDVLDAGTLLARPAFAHIDRVDVEALLSCADSLALRAFAPIAAAIDAQEPELIDGRVRAHASVAQAFNAYAAAGFLGTGLRLETGGLQMPSCLSTAVMAFFGAACTPAAGYAFLTSAAARVIEAFGNDWQKAVFLPPMRDGDWTGTMCLSEAQAGSELARVRTRAIRRDDGYFEVFGSKMWISGGDQDFSSNIVHLVMARIEGGSANASGLSLLVVPKIALDGTSNGVETIGLNHKLGHRGTSNCALSFGAIQPSIGYLIGEPHRGLACMFHMMNEARIGVGVTAAATAYAGFRYSADYARTRVQGRSAATGEPVAIAAHADVQRMLLIQRAVSEGGLCLCLFAARLVDDAATHPDAAAADDAASLLAVLTPLVKLWCSERGLEANSLAIQVMGGAGYVRDHPVERLFRDQRLNPIHEGANGILAIDVVLRGVCRDGGAVLAKLLARIASDCAAAEGPQEQVLADILRDAVRTLEVCTRRLAAGDEASARAWASPFALAVGDTVVAWLWLRQLAALRGRADGPAPAKRACALCMAQLILRQSLAVAAAIGSDSPPPHAGLPPEALFL